MNTRNRIETSLPLSINELYSVPATTRRCPHVSDGELIRQITVRDTDVSLRLLRGDRDYKRHYFGRKDKSRGRYKRQKRTSRYVFQDL